MSLFDLVKQWLADQLEFKCIAKLSKTNLCIIIVSLVNNPHKMLLLVVNDNYITTSKGTLYASNPKFFSLLKKRLIVGLRIE
jgi:hypothetical protein